MNDLIKVLSFGAGVQSTTLLLMSVKGELPKLDYAIFADTGWEPQAVYQHLDWCEGVAAEAGIKLVKVSRSDKRRKGEAVGLRQQTIQSIEGGDRFASIPFFIRNRDGSDGIGLRQCTSEFKIEPIETYMRREILGLKKHGRAPKELKIEQWMGISYDEVTRAKPARVKWKVHAFPLIGLECDYLGKVWRRQDCIRWLETNYADQMVPRSACIGCPYHSNDEWRALKKRPDEWADAVEFDHACREPGRGMKGQQFLHRDCVPLDEADLRTDEDKGQLNLFESECEGMCGV